MPLASSPLPASLVDELLRLLGDAPILPAPQARARLTEHLTRLGTGQLPVAGWPLLDRLWALEAAERSVTHAVTLPRLAKGGWGARASVWRGDITTLRVDAIVNAANAGLTGCYQPFHACVDNAIHTAAGPRLREECERVMAERGRPEPTATATRTAGYSLPASHVLHTVGPIVAGRAPGPGDADALAGCYRACLESAADAGLESVAFCAISTGVYGYPIARAAPVAVAAVRATLEADRRLDHVIFVTYSAVDHIQIASAAEEALRA